MKIFEFLTIFFLFVSPVISQNYPIEINQNLLQGYGNIISTNPPSVSYSIERSSGNFIIKDKYDWLVFVFISGVNNLGILNFSINDINEMEEVGSTEKVAVVVEHNKLTRDKGYLKFGNGAQTYFIVKDNNSDRQIISPVIDETPDGDMGSYRHFSRSVKKAISRFKPEKLMVIVWNHGNGYFGIASDDVSQNMITVPQLRIALNDITRRYGKKIDILAMDACLMQMAEVVSEIKDYASYIMASEEIIPGDGYPYDDMLSCVNEKRNAEEIVKCGVDVYHKAYNYGKSSIFGRYSSGIITLSAIKTSKFNGFLQRLNRWVLAAGNSEDFTLITTTDILNNSFFFSVGDVREAYGGPIINTDSEEVLRRSADLVSYLKSALRRMKDENLKNITEELINYIKKELVIKHKGGDYQNRQGLSYATDTYGLAIYLPQLRYNSNKYEQLLFSRVSLWDDFLKKMLSKDYIIPREIGAYNDLNEMPSDKGIDDEIGDANNQTNHNAYNSGNEKVMNADKYFKTNLFETKIDYSDVGRIDISTLASLPKNINISKNIIAKPSIYSTKYTSIRTMKPSMEELEIQATAVDKRSISPQSVEKKSLEENEKQKSLLTSSVEKAQSSMKDMVVSLVQKTNDVVEKLFPDKEKRKQYEEKLKEFEIEITTNISLLHSRKLLEDRELQNEFMKIDRNRTVKLMSYAGEIIELDRVVSRNYNEKDLNSLSKILEVMLDKSRMICNLEICIPPERLIVWMSSNSYSQANISNVEIAIRKWERIFPDEYPITVRWAQAGKVSFSSTTWLEMSVKERNAVIENIVKNDLASGNENTPLLAFSQKRNDLFRNTQEVLKAVDNVMTKMLENKVIDTTKFNEIKSKPLHEQMYLLSMLFDRGGLRSNPEVAGDIAVINANRTSFTNEVLDQNKRDTFSSYISNNAKAEISSSQTGKKLVEAVYGKNKRPVIVVEYIDGVESKNENGKIVIDAKIIEQYLRVKGYTSEDLVRNERVKKEVLTYISPIIVREMANINTSNKLRGSYAPQTREQYASALLFQAKYTEERFKEDSFKGIFSSMEPVSDYARKVSIVRRDYKKSDNENDFIQTASLRYYPNLPSSSSSRSEILIAVTKELERREKLNTEERKNLDKYAIFSKKDVASLTPYEITNYIKDIKTEALIKLRDELLSDNNYDRKLKSIINSIS